MYQNCLDPLGSLYRLWKPLKQDRSMTSTENWNLAKYIYAECVSDFGISIHTRQLRVPIYKDQQY